MNIKKILVGSAASAIMLGATVLPAFASSPFKSDLSNNNWRVLNINTDEAKLWDINKAQSLDGDGVGFTFNPFSTGWYTVYLNTNYNNDLTGKTMTADTSWTASTQYVNRGGTTADALFRLYFKSAQGNYNSNDYWWSTGGNSLNLLNTVASGILPIPLTNRTLWSNLCGKRADDTNSYAGPNCVGGTEGSLPER